MHAQDVVVALKLAFESEGESYAAMADDLGLSASQVHAAVKRAGEAGLLVAGSRKVNQQALVEFLVHGLKYVFPAKRGPIVRGMPTAHSAPPLNETIIDDEAPVVWPDPTGTVRGESIEPLHKGVPHAARLDEQLYQSLSLIDAIRTGRARERKLAAQKLKAMIQS
ncbi:MAG: hypothetical protein GY811_20135 [Myxococcales bacterium]|nr:hypothetical protein [Myxococcales bacterium]